MPEQKAAEDSVHYMQSKAWADVKSDYGWPSDYLGCGTVVGNRIRIYKRSVPGAGKLFYAPGVAGLNPESAQEFTDFIKKH